MIGSDLDQAQTGNLTVVGDRDHRGRRPDDKVAALIEAIEAEIVGDESTFGFVDDCRKIATGNTHDRPPPLRL